MPASSPAKHKAMSCRILQDISAASRQCTPPSAPNGASTSPCRGGFGKPPPGRLPCKGSCRRQPTEGCRTLPCQYLSGPPPPASSAGVFARRLGPSAAARFRDDASIVPYGSIRQGPARRCRISPPQGGNAPLRLRRTAHPPPLAGEALQTASTQKAPLRKHTASPRPDSNRGPTGRTLIPHSQFLIPNSTSPPPLPSPP